MEETDAAALPGRWCAPSPMMALGAARSRFAYGGAVTGVEKGEGRRKAKWKKFSRSGAAVFISPGE